MSAHLAAIILAAGQGKRMNRPSLAKVMHTLGGIPMIDHVVALAVSLDAAPIVVVVGHAREQLTRHLAEKFGDRVTIAVQAEQLGTGHAIMQTTTALLHYVGDVIVLSGDVPLLSLATTSRLRKHHSNEHATATILTVDLDDPTGYGRIIRNGSGNVERIVEERDATQEEKNITEINSGIYMFDWKSLEAALASLGNNNSQGEYYLTDVIEHLVQAGAKVTAWKTNDALELTGVNTLEQLQELEHAHNERANP